MSERLRPVGRRVLVERQAPEEVRSSGIVVPQAHQDRPDRGVVVAVGDTELVKEGDQVVFSPYAGVEIQDEVGDSYLMMSDTDVLAVIA